MPNSAVYQPTTVTYEQQPNEQRWNCPISYFSRRVTSGLLRASYFRIALCVFGGLLVIIGLSLSIVGGIQYASPSGGEGAGGAAAAGGAEEGLGLVIAGIAVFLLGLLVTAGGAWAMAGRCGARGEGSGGAAALTALNPSTDPLVAAHPPHDDETRTLMDNKDCLSSAEESDKAFDGRPAVA